MKPHLLLFFPALLFGLSLAAGCESDPSRDSDNPGLSVPVRPGGSGETELRLEARLGGRYAQSLRIQEGDWTGIGPGEEIEMTFQATGMKEIGQFDLIMEPDPPTDFDIGASLFAPRPPFVTLRTGVEQQEDGRVRIIGADLNRSTEGDAVLGTLRLRTTADFPRSELRLRVVFFSIGPSSTERDTYTAADLNLGIVVNPQ